MNRSTSNPNGSGSAVNWLDNNGSLNNSFVQVNNATARALGLIPGNSITSDATITFNSKYSWDYNARDGVAAGQLDFVGAALHEIGHALGFRSGVDALDFSPTFGPEDSYRLSVLDLFRFSSESKAVNARDFSADARSKFISLDSGNTSVALLSTGVNFGDGYQASHWKDNSSLGAMDPTAGTGEVVTLRENDLRAFDVIGWTRENTWRWAYADGGSFNSAINWNTRAVPGSSQDAVFDLGLVYTGNVSLVSDATVANFTVRRDSLILAPASALRTLSVLQNFRVGDGAAGTTASLTLTQGTVAISGSASIGSGSGVGTFNQTGGTVRTPSLMIGESTASRGLYLVSGTSTLSVTNSLQIGSSGWGSFAQSGGTVTADGFSSLIVGNGAGSTGVYNFSGGTLTATSSLGAGAYTVMIGVAGTGTFTQTGGTNNSARIAMGVAATGNGTYTMSAGTLTFADLTNLYRLMIGQDGVGVFNQSGGTVNVPGTGAGLIMGFGAANGRGTYNLSGGTFSSPWQVIGFSRPGLFNQTDGTNAATSFITLGDTATGVGTYTLQGGLLVATNVYVGNSGTGVFNQTNGTNTVTSTLRLGDVTGGAGSYTLQGGLLNAPNVTVGNSGVGVFNQTGGTNTITSTLRLGGATGGAGTYTFQGGLLSASNAYIGDGGVGTLTQTGGNITASFVGVGRLGTGLVNQSAGSNTLDLINLGQSSGRVGTYLVSGTAFLLTRYIAVGVASGAAGTFSQTGGVVTAQNGFSVGSGSGSGGNGIYNLSGPSTLTANGSSYVGFGGTGTFAQSGGTFTATDLYAGYTTVGLVNQSAGTLSARNLYLGVINGASGTYLLSGTASLTGSTLYAGYGQSAFGSVSQTGGTVNLTGLSVGSLSGSSGNYSISGSSSLTVSTNAYVGDAGTGTFNQSGGTFTATNLYAGNTGVGSINQSAGTVSARNLYLGFTNGGTGTYLISGTASLSSSNLYVGYGQSAVGSVSQTGGTVTTTGMTIATFSGSTGSYTFSAGSLAVSGIERIINGGTFTQTGGTHSVARLQVGSGTRSLFSISGGTLSVSAALSVDGDFISGARFIHSGGSTALSGSMRVGDFSGVGTLEFSGGTLASSSTGSIGFSSVGLVNQSGGTVSFSGTSTTNTVTLGLNLGSRGTYSLTNGSFMVSNGPLLVGSLGQGTFSQTGGTSTLSSSLLMGFASSSTGSYRLSGGLLTVNGALPATSVGVSGRGTFSQTGGTLVSNGLSISPTGSYALSAGVATTDVIAAGTFTYTGGTLNGAATSTLSGRIVVPSLSAVTFPSGVRVDGGFTVSSNATATITSRLTGAATGQVTVAASGTLQANQINLVSIRVDGRLLGSGAAPAHNVSSISGTGSITVGASGSLTTALVRLGGISIDSGGTVTVAASSTTPTVSVLNSLSLSGTAFFDLADEVLIVRNTPADTIRQYVSSWFASGSRTGPGLATSLTSNPFTTLAVFPNTTPAGQTYFPSLAGISLLATDTIVRYTYLGDTNLDGVLDGQDFRNLMEGYLFQESGWIWGDTDNSGGVTTAADVQLFLDAYSFYQQNPVPIAFPSDLASASESVAIPEPTGLLVTAFIVPPALHRRRPRANAC